MSKLATFAGGCFWCIEHAFEDIPGVIKATSGYAGGTKHTASYFRVATRMTKHKEAVQVEYDPEQVSYEKLLHVFWRNIDPTDSGGQFADRGPEYKTEIMYHDEEQKMLAEASKQALEDADKFADPIATTVVPFTTFFPAEEEHQGYAKRCPIQYNRYKEGSGRAEFIRQNWT